MTEKQENGMNTKTNASAPILQLHRLIYVKICGKILDSTEAKLMLYIRYATERMKTEVEVGDCLDHGLRLLFDRDAGFKEWLKQN